jgi:pyruvate dehydrogenase E2 component (dihydrolipoamide acetyltransferase)
MPIDLKMPALSPTMEKGTLAKWLVAVGDLVTPGDLLAEIETDKATMEFEAIDEGRIARLVVVAGTDDVAVGTVIAVLADAGEDVAKPPPGAEVKAASPPIAAPAALIVHADASALVIDTAINATPLARSIAAACNLSLAEVAGSGAGGRVLKVDLGLPARAATVVAPVAVTAATAPASVVPPPDGVPVDTVKLSGMRKTIARRLTEAKTTVPHFYLTVRCNLDALLALRADLNAGFAARGVKLSINDMMLKAMACALAQVPEANVQFGGDELHRFGRVDIAMAVAIDGGLVTPVIRDAGALSLSAIAEASTALAQKAREGRLLPEADQGGTASLSNLGMFGMDEMVPVLNPPQALILGIGAGVEQPWKVGGGIALATIMAATGSFDHRAIDGAVAARFMAAFREHVDAPMLMLS